MSPVDNKFFELIIPIATFLTGTLSGIMLAGDDKDLRMKAIEAANKPPPPSAPTPSPIRPPSSPAGSFESSAFGAVGAGAVGAAVMATPFPDATPGMPAMAKPAPSRPPLEENFPPLD
jgi:hypothetical protein